MTDMSSMIHLSANDPVAWMAWNDWVEETGTPRVQPCLINSMGMKFSLIPPRKFVMGSPAREAERQGDEGPQHEVEITKAFYLGAFPVTQAEYQRVMGTNPSYFSATGRGKDSVKGKDTRQFPVENVSWNDAVEFCRKLSEMAEEKGSGRKYRLPLECEWEYACRAGTTTSFYFGDTLRPDQANFNESKLGRTCAVGSYPANDFGLFDMHGNVWGWCSDWYEADYYGKSPPRDPAGPQRGFSRVLRGGSFFIQASSVRSALRDGIGPAYRFYDVGFRVAADVYTES